MIKITKAAVERLKTLVAEHPEDPIVRVKVRDEDEARLTFNITLEDATQTDDEVQEIDGLTVAVEGQSISRMDGITLDFQESGGFKFIHPETTDSKDTFKLDLINLN